MTDILFVQNYYEQMLGIMSISALLKPHGFTTDVAIGTESHILNQVVATKPKVVGFYCTTGFHHRSIAIAAKIKKEIGQEKLTVFGGPHPTFVPSMIMTEGVDIICRGEGEYAVLELLRALRAGGNYTQINNLTVKKDGICFENPIGPLCDVNALPHPDREIYRNIKYIYKSRRQEVMLGRGCPFSCSFCSAHAYRELYKGQGPYVRLRSISTAIDELKHIKNCYKPSCFFFHDDTFTFKREYCDEFLVAYKKHIDLPFACLIRADLAAENLVSLLKKTGCYLVSFGIECGNEALRTTLLKKNISDEHILRCAALLHKYKIPFVTFNMVGLPDESLSQVWETVNLNRRVNPAWAWFSAYQTLPQTQLARYAHQQGCLSAVDVDANDASFHESSMILRNHPEAKKIIRLKNCANIIIKFPFLTGFVRKIVLNVPADALYEAIGKLMYFICYYVKLTYKTGLFETYSSALFLARHLREFNFKTTRKHMP